jgi:hypothetical protein
VGASIRSALQCTSAVPVPPSGIRFVTRRHTRTPVLSACICSPAAGPPHLRPAGHLNIRGAHSLWASHTIKVYLKKPVPCRVPSPSRARRRRLLLHCTALSLFFVVHLPSYLRMKDETNKMVSASCRAACCFSSHCTYAVPSFLPSSSSAASSLASSSNDPLPI